MGIVIQLKKIFLQLIMLHQKLLNNFIYKKRRKRSFLNKEIYAENQKSLSVKAQINVQFNWNPPPLNQICQKATFFAILVHRLIMIAYLHATFFFFCLKIQHLSSLTLQHFILSPYLYMLTFLLGPHVIITNPYVLKE